MLIRTEIDGHPATVVFLTHGWKPVDQDAADMIKVMFDDGRVVYAAPRQGRLDLAHAQAELWPEFVQEVDHDAAAQAKAR